MKTLYDLLEALPDDDADGLRAAFRKAARANHPDFNPAPEASEKFSRIIRANAILSDGQQRAEYDRLLELAKRQQKPTTKAPLPFRHGRPVDRRRHCKRRCLRRADRRLPLLQLSEDCRWLQRRSSRSPKAKLRRLSLSGRSKSPTHPARPSNSPSLNNRPSLKTSKRAIPSTTSTSRPPPGRRSRMLPP